MQYSTEYLRTTTQYSTEQPSTTNPYFTEQQPATTRYSTELSTTEEQRPTIQQYSTEQTHITIQYSTEQPAITVPYSTELEQSFTESYPTLTTPINTPGQIPCDQTTINDSECNICLNDTCRPVCFNLTVNQSTPNCSILPGKRSFSSGVIINVLSSCSPIYVSTNYSPVWHHPVSR